MLAGPSLLLEGVSSGRVAGFATSFVRAFWSPTPLPLMWP